jgi:hypothetical protein
MSLQVIERQTTTTWYELNGELEASELFPTLLPNSESVKEIEEDIETEPEEREGKYDGCPQDDSEMEDEIDEFTKSALSEFHDEAIVAAKALLMGLKAGQTLLCREFEEAEETVLEEAAKELGMAIPWDPAEAAQIAADQAAEEARAKQRREQEEQRKKDVAEVLQKARELFKAGNSHSAVSTKFPSFSNEISKLVGELRKEGVRISAA